LTELDFSDCGVSHIDLSAYPKVKKLGLANNDLKSLDESNIRSVAQLEGLDIRNNKIKDMDTIIAVVKDLIHLQAIYLSGNPCFQTDDEENRLKFIAKLLNFMDPQAITIKSINGKMITIQEKVKSFKKLKKSNV